jgi:H+-transporting ATPase
LILCISARSRPWSTARARRAINAKGAPQAISELAKLDAQSLQRYQVEVAALAAKGERALGVARSEDGADWELVGLISLIDPPRPDAKATIAEARRSASTSKW